MGAVKAPANFEELPDADSHDDPFFDIAKSVFQAHGVDVAGQVVIRRQLKRRYVVWLSSRNCRRALLA